MPEGEGGMEDRREEGGLEDRREEGGMLLIERFW